MKRKTTLIVSAMLLTVDIGITLSLINAGASRADAAFNDTTSLFEWLQNALRPLPSLLWPH